MLTAIAQGQCLSSQKLQGKMDVSVLVVGNQQFLAAFLNPIRTIMAGSVEASSCVGDVLTLVQTIHPAVVILQAR
ncbi:MAG TPA: hypothetical protein DCL61_29220, partial [Cyanobacteria bacterium UBA12227]|nr:hypothetical protein [Cyanobacteria bacterium UBA12227]